MPKHSVMIGRLPFGGDEHARVGSWLVETVLQMKADPRVGDIHNFPVNDTPTTCVRNRISKAAKDLGCDFVLMIDSDMAPDQHRKDAGAKEFWPSSWEFALAQREPCIVAAPYCTAPPDESVVVFHWANRETGAKDFSSFQVRYTRELAAAQSGIKEVSALPTGMILFHTAVLDRLEAPWFEYEYTDRFRTHVATTEDVYFTRNASLKGVRCFCNWDAWAGHVKRKVVERPRPAVIDDVREEMAKARERGRNRPGRLVDVPPGGLSLGA
jgi:hypothetical protein